MVQIEKRLMELGITLPPASRPAANYCPCMRSGDLIFLSGHLPAKPDGSLYTGQLGMSVDADQPLRSVEYGYQAARQVGLNLLSTLKQELNGDLDQVEQIVKLFGIVQSAENFHDQHKVMNGCSDLMVQVFGEKQGRHARSAIGTNCLPLNIAVEIEAIVRVKSLN